MDVLFIDTCVLDELLEVPDYCDPKKTENIKREFSDNIDNGYRYVIPLSVIVELGNHISQIKISQERERCSSKFTEFLKHALNDISPWTLDCSGFDEENIKYLVDNFERFSSMKIGAGDINIVYQCMQYRKKQNSSVKVDIWSIDHHITTLKEQMGFDSLPVQRDNSRSRRKQ